MPARPEPTARTHTMIAIAVVVAALYFARGVLIPIALAILLTFLLAPLTIRLRRVGLPRIPAVLVVVTFAFTIIALIAGLVVMQLYDLASELPKYHSNIQAKLETLAPSGTGVLDDLNHLIKGVSEQLNRALPSAEPPPVPGAPETAVVVVPQPAASPIQQLRNVLIAASGPLATSAIVLVFTIFMLVGREDLRDRIIRLAGPGRLNLTTQALDDAAHRVSRYLRMQLAINVMYGVPIGVGLYFIGVPNAFLWGLLATVLRFLPYVGPWIAALMPIALCFAIDPGWSMVGMTIALFIVLELISNNIMEPWLYGSSAGISSMAVLVAAVFWTWLWGAVGLLLATPLTVCLVVLGRYIPRLNFLSVLLGDEPGLSPAARYYQRMLAADFEDITDLVEDYLVDHTLTELYDHVLTPALAMAEQDRHEGQLDEQRELFIFQHTRDLIDDLASRDIPPPQPRKEPPVAARKNGMAAAAEPTKPPQPEDAAQEAANRQAARGNLAVFCLPARDQADELVGMMLAHLLELRGVGARALSAERTSGERLEEVARLKVPIVCVSALPPLAITHARFAAKRMRAAIPGMKMVIGLWRVRGEPGVLHQRVAAVSGETVVTTLEQAVEQIVALALVDKPGPTTVAPPIIPPRQSQPFTPRAAG